MSIPKTIHMIWIGPDPFPYQDNLNSYIRQNPTWKVKLWTDENLPKIKNQVIYDALKPYATKADLLRIEILAIYGGVYADADSYCRRPLDELVEGKTCFFTTNRKSKIEINLMGCEPGSKIIQNILLKLPLYWKKEVGKRERHSIYCIYRHIRKSIRGSEYQTILRIYNCTADEASNRTFVIQDMATTWNDERYFETVVVKND